MSFTLRLGSVPGFALGGRVLQCVDDFLVGVPEGQLRVRQVVLDADGLDQRANGAEVLPTAAGEGVMQRLELQTT